MSTTDFTLNVLPRETSGKGASRRLRREHNLVPAIIYGGKAEPQNISILFKDFVKQLENEAFYSHILTVNIDGKAEEAVLKDLQRHPYKPSLIHVDLLRINENEKLRMHVPIHFIGEDASVGVKAGGVISHLANDVEVSCLPKDLPEFIEADMTDVALDATLHLSDLKLPAGVELVALAHGDDHDLSVAAIHMPKIAAEVETDAPVAPDNGEAEAEEA